MSQKENAKGADLKKSLEEGYKKMARINLSLAELSIEADNEALLRFEEKMTECE